MRCRVLLILCLLVPVIARGNPVVINPSSAIAFGVVALGALVVEAGIVALMLAFAGVAPVRILVCFLAANLAVFFFLFCPLQGRLALPLLEVLVVLLDAACIKLLTGFSVFQGDSYRGVTWQFAGLVSLIGNAASFFVGLIASGSPWYAHTAADLG